MKDYLPRTLAAAACVMLSMLTTAACAFDINDNGRVSAVVELTDGELEALLQTGVFKFSVPYSLRNKVNSLILKRPQRFKDDVAVRFNEVDKRSNTIDVRVDDSTIEQIAYQPVELKIYESGYTNVLVHYSPGNSSASEKPSKADSVLLKTILKSGKSLTGRIFQTKQFSIESSLGDVKVKLKDVSLITVQDDGQLKVMLLNGDTLTGDVDFSSITVKSPWGLERIKLKDIASIVAPLSPDLTPLSGTRSLPSSLPRALNTFPTPARSVATPWQNPIPPHRFGGNPWPVGQHAVPLPPQRIDSLPAIPSRIEQRSVEQNLIQTMPQHPIYGAAVAPQHFNGTESYPVNSVPQGTIFGDLPIGHLPAQQIPMSEFPIGDSLLQQPLPLMNPNQSNNFWLFPQN